MVPELIADYACDTGEGPLWHADEERLYWTDIPTGRMFRYDPATGNHEQFYTGDVVGGFTIQANGGLLLFMAHGAVKIWKDDVLTTVIKEIPYEAESRFNDVHTDPEGRVFCGTMSSAKGLGRLYRLDPNGNIKLLQVNIGCSNGMAFTPDLKQIYYTDSASREIFLFDYDRSTGNLANRRLWMQVEDKPGEGVPDGMTVDAEGCVWTARWGGNCIVRFTPDGREIGRIQFPVEAVSSLTFGGKNFRDIYATTAGGQDKTRNGHEAGALYRIKTDIQGVPEFRSRIGL